MVDDTAISVGADHPHNRVRLRGAIIADGRGAVGLDAAAQVSVTVAASAAIQAGAGFEFSGEGFRLKNRGSIDASGTAIEAGTSHGQHGAVSNIGTITGENGIDGNLVRVANGRHGSIEAEDIAINIHGVQRSDIKACGRISGGTAAIQDGDGALNLFAARCHIQGNVLLGGGRDVAFFFHHTTVTGRVEGGGGNDNFEVFHGARLAHGIAGGDGDDEYDLYYPPSTPILEHAKGGTDTVHALFSYTLPDNVENLVVSRRDGISGIGNGLDNLIVGQSRHDHLDGRGGDDVLINNGGAGMDIFVGGAGADVFVLSQKRAVVDDFKRGEDRIGVHQAASIGDISFEQHGANAWVGLKDAEGHFYRELILRHVDSSALTADDFLFHYTPPHYPGF
jgi:Ca2+-binding RTX toxin-like protein